MKGWLVGIALAAAVGQAEGPGTTATPTPADEFKVAVAFEGTGRREVATGELLARGGRLYHFDRGTREIIIVDPGAGRVELLDLSNRVQCLVPFRRLDAELGSQRKEQHDEIDRREREGGKGNRILARMKRDLIDPRFVETFDADAHRLSLTNGSVEVTALGESEPSPGRREFLAATLAAIVKLGALRSPDNIPPFTRLDAEQRLILGHGLRPTEITFVYRLAGPPTRYRWSYRFDPALTERDRQALAVLDRLSAEAPVLPFEKYETRDPDD